MNKKLNKVIIPVAALAIIGGGATAAFASTATPSQPIEQQEQSEQQESSALTGKATITEKESIQIALTEVPGTVNEVELEDENGTVVYGVEVQAEDGSLNDVKVDAQSGNVLKVETDDEDGEEGDGEESDDEQDQAALAEKATITEEESTQIALTEVPGTVKDVELEDENGTVVYSVKVQAEDGSVQEVNVDAQSGKVLIVEADDDENEVDEEA
uniref:PepSY domain-containing protein n=1 Tax=Batrachochytrium dendrobatidis (strain JAM81 / FGSC 10211) TaxID=684364 RepID=F4PF57_BATDJ|eukprot:XP_006683237.1 hypothetical protein BATDEDRAFT_93007 [Batrachochytrium dendrobatidis JAM81]